MSMTIHVHTYLKLFAYTGYHIHIYAHMHACIPVIYTEKLNAAYSAHSPMLGAEWLRLGGVGAKLPSWGGGGAGGCRFSLDLSGPKTLSPTSPQNTFPHSLQQELGKV